MDEDLDSIIDFLNDQPGAAGGDSKMNKRGGSKAIQLKPINHVK